MNNEKIYTAADFASYHAGTMPAQDMHALEKAALEDPFLSDALDGYVHTNTAMADIETLKGKLLPKEKDETKVVAIPSNKNWMRAAASIIIVFGVGYLFYNINKKDNADSSLADNKIQQEIKVDSIIAEPNKMDGETKVATTQGLTTESQTNSTPSNGFIKLDTTTLQLADNNFSTTPSTVTQPAAPATMEAYKTEEVAADLVAKQYEKKDADDAKSKEVFKDYTLNSRSQNNGMSYYNYNGVVQTATGGPMQNATIKLNNTNIATQTDSKGRFSFKATDSVASVSIAAVGYDRKEALLNSNFTQVLKLDNKNSNLDEVVVTAMGSRKKSASIGSSSVTISDKALEGKIAGVKTNPQEFDKFSKKQKTVEKDSARFNLEAQSFYNYLKQNIKPEADDFGIEYEGQVILSFTVNKHGDPRDIKVVKSLNEKCDTQAKRLLESGPSWYFPKGERRTVVIEF
jgi:CarboxypepD_reg-like domain/Gram-negative bacterial TonB protein C-terminal